MNGTVNISGGTKLVSLETIENTENLKMIFKKTSSVCVSCGIASDGPMCVLLEASSTMGQKKYFNK